jgi:biotin carboxylase
MGLHSIWCAWPEGAVCKKATDVFYPISVVEREEILSICQAEQIDGICTIASDVAAPTVAYVAEKMGLIGNPYEVALRANNKYLMRQALSSKNIPCPSFKKTTSSKQINPKDFRFPLIVKPTDRSGSLGVSKVVTPKDLLMFIEMALTLSFSHEAIIEEYIEGREISVEFISYKSHHFPLQITDKVTTGSPHFVELEHHQPAQLTEEQYATIYDLTKRALEALGVTDGASHSEYKITADGNIYVMEIGARMGGDFIGSDLVRLSTGYDFLKGVIDVSLGCFDSPKFGIPRHAGIYFLCKETQHLKNVIIESTLPQIVCAKITDNLLKSVTCSADRSGYLIYQGNNKLEL